MLIEGDWKPSLDRVLQRAGSPEDRTTCVATSSGSSLNWTPRGLRISSKSTRRAQRSTSCAGTSRLIAKSVLRPHAQKLRCGSARGSDADRRRGQSSDICKIKTLALRRGCFRGQSSISIYMLAPRGAANECQSAFVAPSSDVLRLGRVVQKLFGSERPISEIELQSGEIDPQSIKFPLVPFAW